MAKISMPQLNDAIDALTIGRAALGAVAASFRYDLESGVRGEYSSLKMLPSFLNLPSGKERGEAVALDFGGTNARAIFFRVEHGAATVIREARRPLKVVSPSCDEAYNYLSATTDRDDLFDFLAALVETAVAGDRTHEYRLGWTFSYPSEQIAVNKARLIAWTKEISVPNVEGEEVSALLAAALARRNLANVKIAAIVNDTVAALLAAAYQDNSVSIASIYGTGHNTCCRETYAKSEKTRPPELVNLESGGFSQLFPSPYDIIVDAASERPNAQRLEKMVAGRYLGEIMTAAVLTALDGTGSAAAALAALPANCRFTAEDISALLAADGFAARKAIIAARLAPILGRDYNYSEAEIAALASLARTIALRSARLVAATFAGIIWHTSPKMVRPQTIAIDGSVYNHLPGCAAAIDFALRELLEGDAKKIKVRTVSDGSALGAAIAALMN